MSIPNAKRIINLSENGTEGLIAELNIIDTNVKEVDLKADKAIDIATEASKQIGPKGEDGYTPIKNVDYFDGEPGKDYTLTEDDKKEIASAIEVPIVEKVIEKTKTFVRETPIVTEITKEVLPDDIADKLNTLKDAIDVEVIKGAVSRKDLDNQNKKVLEGMKLVDGRIKLIDQRWGAHGGGLSKVSTDSTLTGTGTPSSPLHVVSSGVGGVTSISNIDSTLIFSTATGAVIASRHAITGDVSIPSASNISTLATVNSNVGTFNNATVTVNAKGLVTSVASGSSGISYWTATGTDIFNNNSGLVGIGTSSPDYELSVVAPLTTVPAPSSVTLSLTPESLSTGPSGFVISTVYGPLDPTGGSSSENFGSGSVYISQGQSWNYYVYAYRNISGITYTDPSPLNIPFQETNNDGSTPFTVSLNWSATNNGDGSGVDGYIVYSPGTGTNTDIGNTTSYIDDGTSAGGASPMMFSGLTSSGQTINYQTYLQGPSPSGVLYYGNIGSSYSYSDPYGNGSQFWIQHSISGSGGQNWAINDTTNGGDFTGTGDQSFYQTAIWGGSNVSTQHYGFLADGSGSNLTVLAQLNNYDPSGPVYSSGNVQSSQLTDPGDFNYYYLTGSNSFGSGTEGKDTLYFNFSTSPGAALITSSTSFEYDAFSSWPDGPTLLPTALTATPGYFENESTDSSINTLILNANVSGGFPRMSFRANSVETMGFGADSSGNPTLTSASGTALFIRPTSGSNAIATSWTDAMGNIMMFFSSLGKLSISKTSPGSGYLNINAGSTSVDQIVLDSSSGFPSSPTPGALGYDGEFYGSDSARRMFARLASASALTSGNFILADASGHLINSASHLVLSTGPVIGFSAVASFTAGASVSSGQTFTLGSGAYMIGFAKSYIGVTTSQGFNTGTDTIDVTANSVTLTLPTAVGATGRIFTAKNSGSGTVTMATTSSQTVDGTTPPTIASKGSYTFQSDGANWIIIAKV